MFGFRFNPLLGAWCLGLVVFGFQIQSYLDGGLGGAGHSCFKSGEGAAFRLRGGRT